MSYCVYILYSITLYRYYVGQASNLEDRLKHHNEGRGKYTKSGIPWKLIYVESFETRSKAMVREEKFKSSESREQLRRYIQSEFNELSG